jgi:Uma2 family endonuclease
MSAVTSQPVPVRAPPVDRAIRTIADLQASLGNVPLNRIIANPPPGEATVEDVIRLAEGNGKRLVELVKGTLVEKPMGLRESVIATTVSTLLNLVVRPQKLGFVSGECGMIRMLMGNVRMPDVAFFRREDLPDGQLQLPREAAPRLAPALAVEVLSAGNTDEEMRMKVAEYFESGVRVVWILDPDPQTVRVYDSPDASERFRQLTRDDSLEAGGILPGFQCRVGELFEV